MCVCLYVRIYVRVGGGWGGGEKIQFLGLQQHYLFFYVAMVTSSGPKNEREKDGQRDPQGYTGACKLHTRTQTRTHTHTAKHASVPPSSLFFSQTKGFFSQLSVLAHEGLTAASCLYRRDFYLQPFGLGWNCCTLLCGAKCMPAMLNSSLSLWGNCKKNPPKKSQHTTTHAHTHVRARSPPVTSCSIGALFCRTSCPWTKSLCRVLRHGIG